MSTPTWPAWEIGVAGLALASAALAAARWIGAARSRWGALAGRVDDLANRLRAVEARADRGEVSSIPSPRGGRASRRAGRDSASGSARPETRRGVPPTDRDPSEPPLILVPSLEATGSSEAADEAVAGLGRHFGAIWAMADAGESPPAIARATGHPVGQVELILGLRRPAPAGEPAPDA